MKTFRLCLAGWLFLLYSGAVAATIKGKPAPAPSAGLATPSSLPRIVSEHLSPLSLNGPQDRAPIEFIDPQAAAPAQALTSPTSLPASAMEDAPALPVTEAQDQKPRPIENVRAGLAEMSEGVSQISQGMTPAQGAEAAASAGSNIQALITDEKPASAQDAFFSLQDQIHRATAFVQKYRAGFAQAVFGHPEMRDTILLGLLADGHILLQGPPGVAKTLAAKTVARLTGLEWARVQFTPDLLPSDITGQEQRDPRTGEWVVRKGPIFANIFLADEINRATPKTQSALLEAMGENQVSIAGRTFALPDPHIVLATKNPIETNEGVYPLPEAQLDRFMFQAQVLFSDEKDLAGVLKLALGRGDAPAQTVINSRELKEARELVRRIEVPEQTQAYIVRLIAATRPEGYYASAQVRNFVQMGASDRAAVTLAKAARAQALLNGRVYVTPEDVKAVAVRVLAHRLVLNFKAMGETTAEKIVLSLIDPQTGVPVLRETSAAPRSDGEQRGGQARLESDPGAASAGTLQTTQVKTAPEQTVKEVPQPAQTTQTGPFSLFVKLRAGFSAALAPLSIAMTLMWIAPSSAEALPARDGLLTLLGAAPLLRVALGYFTDVFIPLLGGLVLVHLANPGLGPKWGRLSVKKYLPWALVLGLFLVGPLRALMPTGGMPALMASLVLTLLRVAGEEGLFRAGIHKGLQKGLQSLFYYPNNGDLHITLSPWIAAFLSSALFAAAHTIKLGLFAWAPLFSIFAVGLICAYLYHKSGDLTTPIAAHALYNVTLLSMGHAGWFGALGAPLAALAVLTAWEIRRSASSWKSFAALLRKILGYGLVGAPLEMLERAGPTLSHAASWIVAGGFAAMALATIPLYLLVNSWLMSGSHPDSAFLKICSAVAACLFVSATGTLLTALGRWLKAKEKIANPMEGSSKT